MSPWHRSVLTWRFEERPRHSAPAVAGGLEAAERAEPQHLEVGRSKACNYTLATYQGVADLRLVYPASATLQRRRHRARSRTPAGTTLFGGFRHDPRPTPPPLYILDPRRVGGDRVRRRRICRPTTRNPDARTRDRARGARRAPRRLFSARTRSRTWRTWPIAAPSWPRRRARRPATRPAPPVAHQYLLEEGAHVHGRLEEAFDRLGAERATLLPVRSRCAGSRAAGEVVHQRGDVLRPVVHGERAPVGPRRAGGGEARRAGSRGGRQAEHESPFVE